MDSRKKKGIVGGVTIFLAATLLIGGTLTWTDFTQNRTNRFRGSVNYDATLHDDFDGENKDVYVENSGESPIYVRVRLDEYMEIGNFNMLGENILVEDPANGIDPVTSHDKEQWITHKYPQADTEDPADCGAVDSTNASANAVADTIQFHKYYEWDMSGDQIKYDPGTPGVVSSVLDDIKVDASGNPVTDIYGTQIPIVNDQIGTEDTLPACAPITMAKYSALAMLADLAEADPVNSPMDPDDQALWDSMKDGCWILDEDGWAYWSQPLAPGTATNLLLDGVTLVGKEPTDDWYYAIDVKLQAVSLNETLTTWKTSGDYTQLAEEFIKSWHED